MNINDAVEAAKERIKKLEALKRRMATVQAMATALADEGRTFFLHSPLRDWDSGDPIELTRDQARKVFRDFAVVVEAEAIALGVVDQASDKMP